MVRFPLSLEYGSSNPFNSFRVYTYANLEILFQWMIHNAPFDAEEKRFELLRCLMRFGVLPYLEPASLGAQASRLAF
jgi:hypothetical protein